MVTTKVCAQRFYVTQIFIQLVSAVVDQFLKQNYADIGTGHAELQGDIKAMHNVTLKGPIVLQVDEFSNIAASREDQIMSQYSRIKDVSEENDDNNGDEQDQNDEGASAAEASGISDAQKQLNSAMKQYDPMQQGAARNQNRTFFGNRMLMLTCNDGKSKVYAMEFQYVPALTPNTLAPGTKVCEICFNNIIF